MWPETPDAAPTQSWFKSGVSKGLATAEGPQSPSQVPEYLKPSVKAKSFLGDELLSLSARGDTRPTSPCLHSGPKHLLKPSQDLLGTLFSNIPPPSPPLTPASSVLSWEPRAEPDAPQRGCGGSDDFYLPEGGPRASAASAGSQMVQEGPRAPGTPPYCPIPPTGAGLHRTLGDPGTLGIQLPHLGSGLQVPGRLQLPPPAEATGRVFPLRGSWGLCQRLSGFTGQDGGSPADALGSLGNSLAVPQKMSRGVTL